MITPSYPDASLKGETVIVDGVSMTLYATNLASSLFLHIVDSQGNEFDIPENLSKLLEGKRVKALREKMEKQITRTMRDTNNPINLPECISKDAASNDNIILLKDHDRIGQDGIPTLSWSNRDLGWSLGIGSIDVRMGFASWDDGVGVQDLVNFMGDEEALSVELALTDPKAAFVLVARMLIEELYNEQTLPALDVEGLRQRLTLDGLGSRITEYSTNSETEKSNLSGEMSLASLMVGGVGELVPLVLRVRPPQVPEFETDMLPFQHPIHIKNQEVWRKRFMAFIETSSDWRFVSLSFDPDPFWITTIPEGLWIKILPAFESPRFSHIDNPVLF